MEKLRDFRMGWLNLERLLFLLSLALLIWAALGLLAGPAPSTVPPDSVRYSNPLGAAPERLPVLDASHIPPNPWTADQTVFALLSAPQLELPAPEPPPADTAVVPPPPYPQPMPRGAADKDKKEKE